jgi:hypothetical protein
MGDWSADLEKEYKIFKFFVRHSLFSKGGKCEKFVPSDWGGLYALR